MRKLAAFVFIFFSANSLACDTSSSEILELVADGKAKEVVRNIWSKRGCEALILKQIATGDAQWLDAALKLYEFADASYSEGIHDSLGQAMLRAPIRVLPLVNTPKHQAAQICMPWMMDDTGSSNSIYLKATDDAIAMFERFRATSYKAQAEACLEVAKRIKLNLESTLNK